MAYTPADRRARALAVIEKAKRRGSLKTKAVASALQTLNSLDDSRYFAAEYHNKPGNAGPDEHYRATIGEHSGGYTIGGELVSISQPATDSEHDRNLGFSEPTPDPQEQFNLAMRETSECLNRLVRWLATGDCLTSVGTRAVALVAALQPFAFTDCSGSQSSIAQKFGLGKAAVQKYVTQIRGLAGPSFQPRNTRPSSVREASRLRAIEQHRRAGHTMRSAAQ